MFQLQYFVFQFFVLNKFDWYPINDKMISNFKNSEHDFKLMISNNYFKNSESDWYKIINKFKKILLLYHNLFGTYYII